MSEVMDRFKEDMIVIGDLIEKQVFSVKDANAFIDRNMSIFNRVEELTKSRDNWRLKYNEEKERRLESNRKLSKLARPRDQNRV